MTNEEKANEIAQLADYTHNFRDVDIAFKSAIEMAQWKDEQYDDKINKVHEDVYDWIKLNCRTDISVADCTNMARWIFKELKDK